MPRGVYPRRQLRERLLSRLVIDPSGCVLWTGSITSQGYGRIQVEGKARLVHRVVYELWFGPIPDGLEIDHLCRVRHCAAPAHLEAVTNAENNRRTRGLRPRVRLKRRGFRLTHCHAGHEYSEANTYLRHMDDGRIKRSCRRCSADAAIRSKARKRVETSRD